MLTTDILSGIADRFFYYLYLALQWKKEKYFLEYYFLYDDDSYIFTRLQ